MNPLRRLAPPLVLFFLTPLVAEYLLGDLTTRQLVILPILALMYGSGAMLIREAVRRTGRGWPCFVLLAIAYGVLEEGMIGQSLFNPNYLHLRLLDYGFLPGQGTAAPWMVYVLSLHVIWSLAVPIGLTEALFADRRTQPWLGAAGSILVGVLFLAGLALTASYSLHQTPFRASAAQLSACGAVIAILVAAALLAVPRASAATPHGSARPPHPALVAAFSFTAGSMVLLAYMMGPSILHWPWSATVAADLAIDLAILFFFAWATGRGGWRPVHSWAAAAGGLLVYAWFGYVIAHALKGDADIVGHSVLVAALLGLCVWAGVRAARAS